jgi:hypothetical protein
MQNKIFCKNLCPLPRNPVIHAPARVIARPLGAGAVSLNAAHGATSAGGDLNIFLQESAILACRDRNGAHAPGFSHGKRGQWCLAVKQVLVRSANPARGICASRF